MPSPNLNFRAPADLLAKIRSRDPQGLKLPGSIAKRDLERWYAALEAALRTVRLTPAEAVYLIRTVQEAYPVNESFVTVLDQVVDDSWLEGWGAARDTLARKLAPMPQVTRWALVDAAERYLAYAEKNPEASTGMALHQVGLHTYDLAPWELEILEQSIAKALKPPVRED